MQIKNIAFNQGDYRYSIEYFDGKAVRKVSTNEEALASFDAAVKVLAERLKEYLVLDVLFNVKVQKIKFGKNEDTASSISLEVCNQAKILSIKLKLYPINNEEHFPDAEQVGANVALREVRGEIDRYLKGERAQPSLPFDVVEEVEVLDDSFLFGGADDKKEE